MTTFAEAFLAVRTRHGLSQIAFSKLIGCDHTYICRLEAGQRLPSRAFIERMGEDFDLPQGDVDLLLAAAGFLPPNRYAGEVDVIAALDALRDPTVPEAARALIAQALRVAGDAGRLVKGAQAA